jgi:hypothetical protein
MIRLKKGIHFGGEKVRTREYRHIIYHWSLGGFDQKWTEFGTFGENTIDFSLFSKTFFN